MTSVLMFRFALILTAMLLSGFVGYMLARHRWMHHNTQRIAVMSGEILKMRRRAHAAEQENSEGRARMARQRRKLQRG